MTVLYECDKWFYVVDEITGVGYSYAGEELWSDCFEDMIEEVSMNGEELTYTTVDGVKGSHRVPEPYVDRCAQSKHV